MFIDLQQVIKEEKKRLKKTLKGTIKDLGLTNILQYPDFLETFNKETDEVSHSKFLAWVMEATKDCKKGKNFLKEIVLEVPATKEKIETLINKEIVIQTEKQIIFTKKLDPDEYRRIDIHVEGSNLLLILENKIEAGLSTKNQLKDYKEYVENNARGRTTMKLLLYSKLNRHRGEILNEAKETGFITITYDEIAKILQKMFKHEKDSEKNFYFLLHCYLSSIYRNIVYPRMVEELEKCGYNIEDLSLPSLYKIRKFREGKMASREIDDSGYQYIKYYESLDQIAERLIEFLDELSEGVRCPKGWKLYKDKENIFDWSFRTKLRNTSKHLYLFFGFWSKENNVSYFYTCLWSDHEVWKKDIKNIREALAEKKLIAKEEYPGEDKKTVYLDIIKIKKNDPRFFDECVEKLKEAFIIIKETKLFRLL